MFFLHSQLQQTINKLSHCLTISVLGSIYTVVQDCNAPGPKTLLSCQVACVCHKSVAATQQSLLSALASLTETSTGWPPTQTSVNAQDDLLHRGFMAPCLCMLLLQAANNPL